MLPNDMRLLSAELLTRDNVASQKNLVGPVFTWYVRIYGRDVTDPLPSSLTKAAVSILSAFVERLEGGVVKRAEASPPTDTQEEHVNISTESHFNSSVFHAKGLDAEKAHGL